jgi:autotransporter translocation and assembly factor TamB
VPILSEGVKLADLSGQLSLGLKKTEKELVIDLDVPELEAVLPPTSDHNLIELEENETISVVGPHRATDGPAEKPEESGTPIVVNVRLGNRVRVKSSIASVRLEGDPVVRLDDELSIRGQVRLAQGGRVEVLGRVFIVDHGTIFFDSDEVSNPLLDTTATWRAPNGVLVRAKLTGRARNPTLEWSSDPPVPGGESAIIALVLGASGSSTAGSSGIAYGAAALNQLLGESGVRGVGITAGREAQGEGQMARISDRGWNSYAATVQVSDEIWFEGKYTLESVGPGVKPRSGFSGTVDWRFHPSWSARTEVGTLGLGADLLWQYRY